MPAPVTPGRDSQPDKTEWGHMVRRAPQSLRPARYDAAVDRIEVTEAGITVTSVQEPVSGSSARR
ncbi:hypothetical protein GCM10025331_20240 [Actinoplanes utahensis]|nr:hypothetical protein Aut01nite_37140 [Actinoplanes utahensis]